VIGLDPVVAVPLGDVPRRRQQFLQHAEVGRRLVGRDLDRPRDLPAIPAGAAVVLAIYGTALDLSALRGQPPGTDLLIMPGTPYTVTVVAAHTDTTPTRLTLTE